MTEQEKISDAESGSEETQEQAEVSKQLKEMAGSLEKRLSEKTLYEKVVAETQTRKVPMEQQEKRIQKVDRGESNRFERGQILKAYKILRKEIAAAEKDGERAVGKRGLLKEIRGRAKEMERGLDRLEGQFENNVKVVEVDTKYGKFSVPVTELDLKGKEEGKEDERVPYIFWGGIGSNVKSNGCVIMSMALSGQRVIGIPHFEQKQVQKPEGVTAANIFKGERGFDTHAEVTKGVAEALGFKKYNLIGYSTGADIALETAIKLSGDPASKGKLNDLIAIEPVGLDEAGVEGLVTGLGKNILQDMPFSEARIKVLKQGVETSATEQKLPLEPEAILTLAEKHFTAERLGQIEVGGSFQWWAGRSSGLTDIRLTEKVVGKTKELMQEKNPNAHVPQLVEVTGATHYSPITNAMGFVQEIESIKEQGEQAEPRILNRKDLANSAARQILKDIEK